MTDIALFIPALLAFAVSAYGWGRTVFHFAYPESRNYFAHQTALGIAVLIFLGGILNCLHLAYNIAVFLLFFTGLLIAAASLFFAGTLSLKQLFRTKNLFLYIMPLMAAGFLIATLIPSNAFNYHDDFHTYIERPIRMLQTGSLGGNPFELLGFDSLGSQAFLQSFIVSVFPIDYLNGFDAVFCFVLCMFLLIEISGRLNVHWLFSVVALITFIAIDPLIVNLSSLYSGCLMITGLLFAALLLLESHNNLSPKNPLLQVIPFSLFMASLITLKMTFIVFCGLFSMLYFTWLFLTSTNRKYTIRLCLLSALSTLFFLIPWILVSLPKYMRLFSLSLSSKKIMTPEIPVRGDFLTALFSFKKFYGNINSFDYNFIFYTFCVVLLVSMIMYIKNTKNSGRTPLIISAAGAGLSSYVILAFLFNNYGDVPRYAIPVLIAVSPAILLLVSRNSLRLSNLKAGGIAISLLILFGVSIILFSDSLAFRIKRLYHYRTPLAFKIDLRYIRYNRAVLEKNSRYLKWIRHLQSKTDGNETILAWISDPFYLNFRRNNVLTMAKPELLQRRLPLRTDDVIVEKFLKNLGVRYIIWGYNEPGMYTAGEYEKMLNSTFTIARGIAAYGLYFIKSLKSISERSNIIFNDGTIMIFDIGTSPFHVKK